MFYKKTVPATVMTLAKQVYEEVETFKNYLTTTGLSRKIDGDIVLLGASMFRHPEQEHSLLVSKIREDRARASNSIKQKNNYLLNSYIYISKLFSNIF